MLVVPEFRDYGLGRLRAVDLRDKRFSLRAALSEAEINLDALPQRSRRWRASATENQRGSSECTRYAITHRLGAAPIMVKDALNVTAGLYELALEIDEFPGNDPTEGTSVRAICKAAQQLDLIRSYHWITQESLLRKYVRKLGPVIGGTDWTDKMFSPDARGFVDVTGAVVGGHAFAIHWHYPAPAIDAYLCQNSWGAPWGVKGGYFFIRTLDMRELLEDRAGEAAEVFEVRKAA